VLRKQRASLERKQRLLEKDVAVGDEAPGLERLGELLKGNLREVRPGADSIQVRDFESGEPQEIPLDPKLSPAENLKALFRRARKAAKRGLRAAQDLEGARERLAAIDALAARREAAGEDAAALQELAEDPEIARLLDRYFPAPRESAPTARKKVWKLGKRELPARLVPKRYRTAEGLEVWVGRSDEGNDLLTTRLARGNDLFLHLEGSPGSHVVLRTEGGAEPPQEALLDAAELAVQFSKQKNTSRAAVHVARIKDVSKPSGTKPGLVYVHRGRTLQLRRDPARLKRITASRIED
jgi:predicted ribosome quality control (RQC) complex YloA/Tae2 family protein